MAVDLGGISRPSRGGALSFGFSNSGCFAASSNFHYLHPHSNAKFLPILFVCPLVFFSGIPPPNRSILVKSGITTQKFSALPWGSFMLGGASYFVGERHILLEESNPPGVLFILGILAPSRIFIFGGVLMSMCVCGHGWMGLHLLWCGTPHPVAQAVAPFHPWPPPSSSTLRCPPPQMRGPGGPPAQRCCALLRSAARC